MLLRNKIKCLPKILVYSILIVIFCCSCSAETDSGAKSVVDGYCKEIQNYDLEASKEYLASKSSEYNVYMSTNIYSVFEDFFKENASKIEYTIINEEIDSSDQI